MIPTRIIPSDLQRDLEEIYGTLASRGGRGSPGDSSSNSGTPLNQGGLRQRFDRLAEDNRQSMRGRNVASVTHTNTITTV